jgi:hypothetical protein
MLLLKCLQALVAEREGFGWSRLGESVGRNRLIANIHFFQLVAPFFYSFPESAQFLLKPLFPGELVSLVSPLRTAR